MNPPGLTARNPLFQSIESVLISVLFPKSTMMKGHAVAVRIKDVFGFPPGLTRWGGDSASLNICGKPFK